MEKKETKKKVTPKKSLKEVVLTGECNGPKIVVKFKKLREDAVLPFKTHEGDAAFDLKAVEVEYDYLNNTYIYHTGLACETVENIHAYVMPRSSNKKTDAYMPNSPGLIDTFTYRGEICIMYKNVVSAEDSVYSDVIWDWLNLPWWKRLFVDVSDMAFNKFEDFDNYVDREAPYEVGDKVAQIMFVKGTPVEFEEVSDLSKTERGEDGFGSTGK